MTYKIEKNSLEKFISHNPVINYIFYINTVLKTITDLGKMS